MASALTVERVQRDVEILARAGLEIGTFIDEMHTSLSRAIPYAAACAATVDPATTLLTGTYKYGDLAGKDEKDSEWGLIEYGGEEPTAFRNMARASMPALGVTLHLGDANRSPRMREFITPYFGYTDELRIVAKAGDTTWGGLAVFRESGAPTFDGADVEIAASVATHLAAGIRAGLLARLAAAPPPLDGVGPSVIIVDRQNNLSQVSVGAESRLADMITSPHSASPTGIVTSLVAGARRYAAGVEPSLPSSRVRLRSGQWFVLHASPLSGAGGPTGDVVITIEEARPPEIVPLVVAAFGLTARERDVTQLVLQGVETKEIASTLHMSAYTVQDHLKAVFGKADVRSRRELIAKVFFDQYVPRMGAQLAPQGFFANA